MTQLAGSARNYSLFQRKNLSIYGMGDVRREFEKAFPELKAFNHMNQIAEVMLVVNFQVLSDKTGLTYDRTKQKLIVDACKVILNK